MLLLDSEQLEFAFQAHGILLESEARNFYTQLWSFIQSGEKIRAGHDLTVLTAALRQECQTYFSGVRQWRVEEESHCEDDIVCDAALDNMREARRLLPRFEKQFFRYLLCYLELNRALIQNRRKLSHFAKNYNIDDHSNLLEVNNATGDLLARVHADRHVLLEKRARLTRVRGLLEQFNAPMEFLGEHLPKIYGAEKGDRELTLFKGALRHLNFTGAEMICRAWENDRLKEHGLQLVLMARTHLSELKTQETLILHTGELSLILEFLKKDEDRLDDFLEKFNVPYMVFQYRNLIRQGYLLGRLGSIEGLIIQHAKLSALAARTHGDNALAHLQTGAILVPARLLLDREFKSLSAIFTEVETTCAILEKLFSQTRDYQS